MEQRRVNIWEDGEYQYPLALGVVPNLRVYLHEDDQVRPAMIVVAGGGYEVVSPSEAWLVGEEFFDKGYQIFVLTYTTDPLRQVPLKDQPMKDLSRAIRVVRKNAAAWRVQENRISVCGFSAGGHLTGTVAVHYADIKEENKAFADISNRPDAVILSYAVIHSGKYRHDGSIQNLLGQDLSAVDSKELDYYSVEKHVTKDTPPCFLWHTALDALVPTENCLMMAEACKKAGINYALHIFSKGLHGISLANHKWQAGEDGETYTFEQTSRIVEAIAQGTLAVSEEKREEMERVYGKNCENYFKYAIRTPVPEVQIWPVLVDDWLKGLWQ